MNYVAWFWLAVDAVFSIAIGLLIFKLLKKKE